MPRDEENSEQIRVSTKKTPSIIVTHYIDQESEAIAFFINSVQRPDTNIKGTQGDHSIAYIAILEAMLSCTNSKGITESIESFKKFANGILNQEGKNKFREINPPKVHGLGVRVALFDCLLKDENILKKIGKSSAFAKVESSESKNSESENSESDDSEDQYKEVKKQIELINKSAQLGKINALAHHLCELASCFLESVQQEKLTTFYSSGRIKDKKSDGDHEKGAARALIVLNLLCKLCKFKSDSEEFEEELKYFMSCIKINEGKQNPEDLHIVRYGINRWFDQSYTNNMQKSLENKKLTNLEKKKIIRKVKDKIIYEESDQIVKFIGDLLDYPRKITFKQKAKKNIKEIKNKFGEDETVEDTENDIVIVRRKNVKNLIKILSKYSKIFSSAFPDLNEFIKFNEYELFGGEDINIKTDIMNEFLEKIVLKEQGWSKLNIDAEYLKDEINKMHPEQSEKKPSSSAKKATAKSLEKKREDRCALQ